MAKDIKINGVTYNGVKDIDVPLSTGGGTAKFMETSDATANADDVAVGTTAYSKGAKVVGTLDISGKADKVSGATNDNLAALDGNGNLKDSGSKATDFAAKGVETTISNHVGDTNNPHGVTSLQVSARPLTVAQSGTVDFNSFDNEGSFYIPASATLVNAPPLGNCWLLVYHRREVGQDGSLKQLAFRHGSVDVNDWEIYVRSRYNNVWSSWREIITTEGGVFRGTVESDTGNFESFRWRRTVGGIGRLGKIGIGGDGSSRMELVDWDNTEQKNAMSLFETYSTFAKPLNIAGGGTGSSTAANARTSLGLSNDATGRGNLGLGNNATGRSNLGFRTYNGGCTVASGAFYGDVTVSGATTSSLIFVNLKDARVNTSGIYPVHGYVTANNNVRVYFSNSTASARTYPIHILAVG